MDECEELVRNSSSLSETCWFRIFVFVVLIASCLDLDAKKNLIAKSKF